MESEKTTPISYGDILEKILQDYNHMDNYRHIFVFTMKRMGIRCIRKKGVDVLCACTAIRRSGLPITANLVKFILEKKNPGVSFPNIQSAIHILGDKHLLVLKANRHPMEWTFNSILKDELVRYNFLKGEPSYDQKV